MNEDLRRRQERTYNFEGWAQPAHDASRKTFAVQFQPDPPAGYMEHSHDEPPATPDTQRVQRFLYVQDERRSGSGALIGLIFAECASPAAARTWIMDVLASQMFNVLQPSEFLGIGEICFAPPGPDPVFVLFALGSVAVQVQSLGGIDVSVADFARQCGEGLGGLA